MKRGHDHKLSSIAVRPGCKVMKLDRSKAEGKFRFPWIQKKKAQSLKERQQTYANLTRIGKVSMVQIGEDEFRTPTRKERRHARMRGRNKSPVAAIAQKKGLAALRVPIARVGEINRDCDRRKNAREDRQYGVGV